MDLLKIRPIAYFSSAIIRTCNIQGIQIRSLLYGIFKIGQQDKNIGNVWKWPIYIFTTITAGGLLIPEGIICPTTGGL